MLPYRFSGDFCAFVPNEQLERVGFRVCGLVFGPQDSCFTVKGGLGLGGCQKHIGISLILGYKAPLNSKPNAKILTLDPEP